jgi:hypothetical protein
MLFFSPPLGRLDSPNSARRSEKSSRPLGAAITNAPKIGEIIAERRN